MRSIKRVFERAKTIKAVLQQPGGRSFAVKPVMLNASFAEIPWMGRLLLDGLFDGNTAFAWKHCPRIRRGSFMESIFRGYSLA